MERVKNELRPSVFPNRPWMMSLGAAAAGGEGNKGLKGIVAGKSYSPQTFNIFLRIQ